MDKKCENCKYYVVMSCCPNWCIHKDHFGAEVPNFTLCPEHEYKEAKIILFEKEIECNG